MLPESPLVQLPHCPAQYLFKVTGDWDSGFKVDSTGLSGPSVHDVHASVRLKSIFEYAIFGDQGMEFKNGTTVNVFKYPAPDPPLLVGTNSTDFGALNMKFGVTIDGDAAIGPGGDPSVVINSSKDSIITGAVYPLSHTWDMPFVPVPPALQFAPSGGILNSPAEITTDGKFDSIRMSNGNLLTINGNVTLYVRGDLILDNASELQITAGSSLTLFIGGNLISKNGGTINNLTQDAKSLYIFGLPGCNTIEFKNTTTLYAAVYAPNADVVTKNSASIYGSIIANSFTQMVAADFYYDASLRDVQPTDFGVTFTVNRWWED